MKISIHFILAFGIVLAFACSAWSRKVEDDTKSEIELESRTGGLKDKVQPRVHHHHGYHHDSLHHHHAALHHHGHVHHALHHGLTHTALHHPILTKKLLLLKFKKIGAIAHHHHHGFHHHHHDVHKHLLPLLHHHHHLRGSGGPSSDSVIEVIPISDTTGALAGYGASPSSHVHDTPTIQAYTVPSDYLEGVNDGTDEIDLENYEDVNLDETPESTPINKHLIAADDPYNQQPVYLYAVPQQVDLARSVAARITKNKKKFKN